MNIKSISFINTIRPVRLMLAFAGAVTACCTHVYGGGSIVVDNDEWTLSDTGFNTEGLANGTTYAQNAANFLTGGSGPILIYSSDFALTGADLNTALTTGGYSVTEDSSLSTPFNETSLSAYKAIFLGGNTLPSDYVSVLQTYVNNGGSVYISGGTGYIGNEGAYWTAFLGAYGLSMADPYNGIQGTIPVVSTSPVLAGVSQLYYNNGDTVSASGSAQVITYDGSAGLIGTYTSSTISAPDGTSTLFLTALSLALLGFSARFSRLSSQP